MLCRNGRTPKTLKKREKIFFLKKASSVLTLLAFYIYFAPMKNMSIIALFAILSLASCGGNTQENAATPSNDTTCVCPDTVACVETATPTTTVTPATTVVPTSTVK